MTTPQEFNQSLRELLEVVRTADFDNLPDSAPDLAALQADIEAVTAAVAPAVVPGVRMQAGLDYGGQQMLSPQEMTFDDPNKFFPYSPVLGSLNPVSPVANFDVVDGEIHGQVTMGSVYNGPPGSVHGGMIALVMDEVLGAACLAYGSGAFTGTLSIRYQRLVPLDTPLELRGWVDGTEGRKVFAKGEIRLDGEVLSAAEGIFIQAREV